jgi:hypothetical protein
MKLIQLGRSSNQVIVDDGDYEFISQWKWHNRQGYAIRVIWLNKERTKRRTVQMHRVLLGAPDGVPVDHINGNPLDNRRANLRLCTPVENSRNRTVKSTYRGRPSSSQYKGVSADKGVWCANIRVNNTLKHLGLFQSEIEAAQCYDAAAGEFFGEFARVNFPEERDERTWEEIASSSRQKKDEARWRSKYSGVSWHHGQEKWVAQYGRHGGPGYIGLFSTEEAAAKAVDSAAFKHSKGNARLNFPSETPVGNWRSLLEKSAPASRYKGVSKAKKDGQWRSRINIKAGGKTREKQIGVYDSEIEAAKAYDKVAIECRGSRAKLNFPEDHPNHGTPRPL